MSKCHIVGNHMSRLNYYIFQLLGFGVLTVGIWTHLNRGPYGTLLPNSSFLSATTLTIAAGAIIFIVGFCGCCSAMMESQCMLVVVSKKIISFVLMDQRI